MKIEKRKSVKQASTNIHGIRFYSNRHKGYVAEAVLDENDNIVTIFRKEKSDKVTIIASIIFDVILILLSTNLYTVVIVRVLMALEAILSFIGLIVIYHISSKIRTGNLRRLHGAEHTVVNAYEKLQRMPTVEEASGFSHFNSRCGTNFNASHIFSSIAIIVASFYLTSWKMGAFVFLTFFITNVLVRLGAFNFIQFITTEKPKEQELEVALAGLKVWEEKENQEKP